MRIRSNKRTIPSKISRRYPVGAELQPEGGVHFRVWAPERRRVEVVLENEPEGGAPRSAHEMAKDAHGYFSAFVAEAEAGTLYRMRLDEASKLCPDPASRFQPAGTRGPSQVVDAAAYTWGIQNWPGVRLPGQVLYEMHIGTFTRLGTWEAAQRELAELSAAGITLLEILPVAEWPGAFGWGYDGVHLFAPSHNYGVPDDFRAFVDEAHRVGMGVILDVVYNHVGTKDNCLQEFSPFYFTDRYENDWGEAINFDDNHSAPVRDFVLTNARYWIDEFHLDGYRLDATQAFHDSSRDHILTAITRAAREAAGDRPILVIGENEPQEVRMIRAPERGGHGMDALWNDDFHHSAMVRLTGRNEAYYGDYLGQPDEFIATMKWSYLFQGQRHSWQKKRRGTPTFGIPAMSFVNYLQNHDQLANSADGRRVHQLTSPARYRAMTAVLLLGPQTPLLFQGQEFAASTPFRYFLDNDPDTARQVAKGRAEFLKQFRSLALPEMQERLRDPADPVNFQACKLNFEERTTHAQAYALHKDLLKLRRDDTVFSAQRADHLDGSTLSADCFVMRFFGQGHDDRLLIVNFGRDLHLDPAPQPLLAPPINSSWQVVWSSEEPAYGGTGTPPLETDENWRIPGEAAVVLCPTPRSKTSHAYGSH